MGKILLVDDDLNLLESAKDILEDAGYQVQTASTLANARTLLAATRMDVLMVDFNLPDGKGSELAKETRTRYPALKIILMTGEALAGLQNEGFYDVLLSKPVDPATLLAMLASF